MRRSKRTNASLSHDNSTVRLLKNVRPSARSNVSPPSTCPELPLWSLSAKDFETTRLPCSPRRPRRSQQHSKAARWPLIYQCLSQLNMIRATNMILAGNRSSAKERFSCIPSPDAIRRLTHLEPQPPTRTLVSYTFHKLRLSLSSYYANAVNARAYTREAHARHQLWLKSIRLPNRTPTHPAIIPPKM